jgi:undecaprenyl diphosphate synthase
MVVLRKGSGGFGLITVDTNNISMSLPLQLDKKPRHIAIIMDGNGRWAERHHLSRIEGHRQGAENARRIVFLCKEYGIPFLTLYTFSTENWNRPKSEVEGLMSLVEESLDAGISIAIEEGVRLHHLGSQEGLSSEVKAKIQEAMEVTKNNTRLTLCLAFNYGGRDDITQAVRHILHNKYPPEEIDSSLIDRHLYTADIPDPDLIIRTGGEQRLSNFLLWQAAYAEIYFTSVLWPDFKRRNVDRALVAYNKRRRRFGGLKDV